MPRNENSEAHAVQFYTAQENPMKTTDRLGVYQVIIAFALLMTLGCTPKTVISGCDHDHTQQENGIALPDFGFNPGGTCNDPGLEASAAEDAESEDALLKDIEEPPADSSSDLAATVEEKGQAS